MSKDWECQLGEETDKSEIKDLLPFKLLVPSRYTSHKVKSPQLVYKNTLDQ